MEREYKEYFEHLGYFKEYYVNGKPIGIIYNVEKDREIIGWSGRKTETVETEIIFENKKKIKAGTEVMTILYPLNGKRTNS